MVGMVVGDGMELECIRPVPGNHLLNLLNEVFCALLSLYHHHHHHHQSSRALNWCAMHEVRVSGGECQRGRVPGAYFRIAC